MKRNITKIKEKNKHYKYGGYVHTTRPKSYMSETKVRKVFIKWLKNNMHRFKYKPYAVNSVCREYYFEGIIKNVTLMRQGVK